MEKIYFVSLGCDKNLVDSQIMLGLLSGHGFETTDLEDEADAVVINTCCFIGDARDESIETIIKMGKLKEKGRCRAIVVTGCLAQRYKEEILKELPEVDAVLGTSGIDRIAEAVRSALDGKKPELFDDIDLLPMPDADRAISRGTFSDYLKIAEGCDKNCTYCIIPSLRGKYRSYPMDYLLDQAKNLAKKGVRELNIVAQETTLYGKDIYGKKMLPELLAALSDIEGIEWIRLLYCYPEEIDDELLKAMSSLPKLCHYLDLPIQHASDDLLRRMGRRTSSRDIKQVIEKIRKYMPDAVIRTTLISGFPGERHEDHRELLSFVEEMSFDRLGVFAYSQEEGTPAAEMPSQIDEELKEERREEIMLLQQRIAFEKAEKMKGRKLDVLIEGKLSGEPVYVGRSYMDAPDIDGCVFIEYEGELISGEIIPVIITGAKNYDLIGEIAYESAQ